MHVLDKSFKNPSLNLSIEEVLLDEVGKKRISGVLRFWESEVFFVVLGHAGKLNIEVERAFCENNGISVHRRVSGGGTVLQGKGCLNYSVILPVNQTKFSNISNTTCNVMKMTAKALDPFVESSIEIKGVSDLVLNGKKFSGNAQKRTKDAFLFHGTILYDFDLGLIETSLKEPPRQPDYRKARTHKDFVRNISVPLNEIKRSLAQTWGAHEILELNSDLVKQAESLAQKKYDTLDWIQKF